VLTGFIFYFLNVFPGTGGEICMSRTMKTVGEVTDFRPRAILHVIGRAMSVPWFWVGITMMAAGFFSLLGLLSVANVSFVFPATAISYAVGTLGGKIFLRERVTPQRWFGVLLVCVGVALVFLGTK
jgi:drug/metabolite transporter (DMT)-like permease